MSPAAPRPHPDLQHVRDAMTDMEAADEAEAQPTPPEEEPPAEADEVPSSEELDVEGPNESAPGHNPQEE